MLVPILGLLLSLAVFGAVGVLALRVLRIEQRRLLALLLFVASAQLGMLAFAVLYGAVFANADNQLATRTQVWGLLLGLPVSGSLVAWMAVRRAVGTRWWARSPQADV